MVTSDTLEQSSAIDIEVRDIWSRESVGSELIRTQGSPVKKDSNPSQFTDVQVPVFWRSSRLRI